MFFNKAKKKAQAMLEYILIVAFTSFAFISVSPLFEKSIKAFFSLVVSLWGQKTP